MLKDQSIPALFVMSIIAHVIESLYTGVLSHNSLLLRNPLSLNADEKIAYFILQNICYNDATLSRSASLIENIKLPTQS
jgi:hypothetical protein